MAYNGLYKNYPTVNYPHADVATTSIYNPYANSGPDPYAGYETTPIYNGYDESSPDPYAGHETTPIHNPYANGGPANRDDHDDVPSNGGYTTGTDFSDNDASYEDVHKNGGYTQGASFSEVDRSDEGSASADTLWGTDSADRIDTGGGRDSVNARGGDDVILVSDTGFNHIDGGSGTDTISFVGHGIDLDLTKLSGYAIQHVETIDISGQGANSLELSSRDVSDILYGTWQNELHIIGHGNDEVIALGFEDTGENRVVDDVAYDVYSDGQFDLWIDQDMGHIET